MIRAVQRTLSVFSFAQSVLWLPLVLSLAGRDAFLALSLALTVYCGLESTFSLVVRNTRLAFLGAVVKSLHVVSVPTILLLCLNIYSPSTVKATSVATAGLYDVLRHLPGLWEIVLRYSTAFFVLAEGVSTLLVIQSCGQFSRYLINERSDGFQFLFLITSATTYVAGAYTLVRSYPFVANDAINATLIGVSITSIFFLSAIAFAMKRTSVVETSLMFAYTTLNIFLLMSTSLEDPVAWIQNTSKASDPPLPPLILQSFSAIALFLSRTFGQGLDVLGAACVVLVSFDCGEQTMHSASALPLPVLIGLLYRLFALYAASRVIVAIRRGRADYDPGTRLSEEEPATRTLTLILYYSRPIQLSTYTHLLLLENDGHHRFWRWLNVILTTALWGVEILLSKDDTELDTVVRGFLKPKDD